MTAVPRWALLASLLISCSPEGSTVFAPAVDAVADAVSKAEIALDTGTPQETVATDAAIPDLAPVDLSIPDAAPDLLVDLTAEITDPDVGPAPCQGDGDCDDQKNCTNDACVEGYCQHEAPPGSCCEIAADCNDGIACTDDKCVGGSCKHYLDDNLCCWNDAMCADGNDCTLDRCAGETCSHAFLNGYDCACSSYLDCDDGLPCTADSCLSGKCSYELKGGGSGCCSNDAQCADNDPVTVDACIQNTCSNLPAPPCITAAHCADENPCTEDLCDAGGHCTNNWKASCCLVNGQCDDGTALTIDVCAQNACVYSFADPPTACATADECPDSGPCVATTCQSGLCSNSVLDGGNCCVDSLACDDGNICTVDNCSGFACAHTPLAGFVPHQVWKFDDGSLTGFQIEGGGNGVTWQLTNKQAISTPFSLYFGNPNGANGPTLNNGETVAGKVVTPAVTLPADGPHLLRVWAFIDCEALFSRDVVTLYVRTNGQDTPVWTKADIGGTTGLSWEELEVDLSPLNLGGKSIQLVFGFDSIDNINNDYQGLYFDDIRLLWPCKPQN